MNVKIVVVDDEPAICELVKLYLKRECFTVYTASDGAQALEVERKYHPDLFILDIMLPKLSGWEICKRIKRPVPIIFMTANYNYEDMLNAYLLGAEGYIAKPFEIKELVAQVKGILDRKSL